MDAMINDFESLNFKKKKPSRKTPPATGNSKNGWGRISDMREMRNRFKKKKRESARNETKVEGSLRQHGDKANHIKKFSNSYYQSYKGQRTKRGGQSAKKGGQSAKAGGPASKKGKGVVRRKKKRMKRGSGDAQKRNKREDYVIDMNMFDQEILGKLDGPKKEREVVPEVEGILETIKTSGKVVKKRKGKEEVIIELGNEEVIEVKEFEGKELMVEEQVEEAKHVVELEVNVVYVNQNGEEIAPPEETEESEMSENEDVQTVERINKGEWVHVEKGNFKVEVCPEPSSEEEEIIPEAKEEIIQPVETPVEDTHHEPEEILEKKTDPSIEEIEDKEIMEPKAMPIETLLEEPAPLEEPKKINPRQKEIDAEEERMMKEAEAMLSIKDIQKYIRDIKDINEIESDEEQAKSKNFEKKKVKKSEQIIENVMGIIEKNNRDHYKDDRDDDEGGMGGNTWGTKGNGRDTGERADNTEMSQGNGQEQSGSHQGSEGQQHHEHQESYQSRESQEMRGNHSGSEEYVDQEEEYEQMKEADYVQEEEPNEFRDEDESEDLNSHDREYNKEDYDQEQSYQEQENEEERDLEEERIDQEEEGNEIEEEWKDIECFGVPEPEHQELNEDYYAEQEPQNLDLARDEDYQNGDYQNEDYQEEYENEELEVRQIPEEHNQVFVNREEPEIQEIEQIEPDRQPDIWETDNEWFQGEHVHMRKSESGNILKAGRGQVEWEENEVEFDENYRSEEKSKASGAAINIFDDADEQGSFDSGNGDFNGETEREEEERRQGEEGYEREEYDEERSGQLRGEYEEGHEEYDFENEMEMTKGVELVQTKQIMEKLGTSPNQSIEGEMLEDEGQYIGVEDYDRESRDSQYDGDRECLQQRSDSRKSGREESLREESLCESGGFEEERSAKENDLCSREEEEIEHYGVEEDKYDHEIFEGEQSDQGEFERGVDQGTDEGNNMMTEEFDKLSKEFNATKTMEIEGDLSERQRHSQQVDHIQNRKVASQHDSADDSQNREDITEPESESEHQESQSQDQQFEEYENEEHSDEQNISEEYYEEEENYQSQPDEEDDEKENNSDIRSQELSLKDSGFEHDEEAKRFFPEESEGEVDMQVQGESDWKKMGESEESRRKTDSAFMSAMTPVSDRRGDKSGKHTDDAMTGTQDFHILSNPKTETSGSKGLKNTGNQQHSENLHIDSGSRGHSEPIEVQINDQPNVYFNKTDHYQRHNYESHSEQGYFEDEDRGYALESGNKSDFENNEEEESEREQRGQEIIESIPLSENEVREILQKDEEWRQEEAMQGTGEDWRIRTGDIIEESIPIYQQPEQQQVSTDPENYQIEEESQNQKEEEEKTYESGHRSQRERQVFNIDEKQMQTLESKKSRQSSRRSSEKRRKFMEVGVAKKENVFADSTQNHMSFGNVEELSVQKESNENTKATSPEIEPDTGYVSKDETKEDQEIEKEPPKAAKVVVRVRKRKKRKRRKRQSTQNEKASEKHSKQEIESRNVFSNLGTPEPENFHKDEETPLLTSNVDSNTNDALSKSEYYNKIIERDLRDHSYRKVIIQRLTEGVRDEVRSQTHLETGNSREKRRNSGRKYRTEQRKVEEDYQPIRYEEDLRFPKIGISKETELEMAEHNSEYLENKKSDSEEIDYEYTKFTSQSQNMEEEGQHSQFQETDQILEEEQTVEKDNGYMASEESLPFPRSAKEEKEQTDKSVSKKSYKSKKSHRSKKSQNLKPPKKKRKDISKSKSKPKLKKKKKLQSRRAKSVRSAKSAKSFKSRKSARKSKSKKKLKKKKSISPFKKMILKNIKRKKEEQMKRTRSKRAKRRAQSNRKIRMSERVPPSSSLEDLDFYATAGAKSKKKRESERVTGTTASRKQKIKRRKQKNKSLPRVWRKTKSVKDMEMGRFNADSAARNFYTRDKNKSSQRQIDDVIGEVERKHRMAQRRMFDRPR